MERSLVIVPPAPGVQLFAIVAASSFHRVSGRTVWYPTRAEVSADQAKRIAAAFGWMTWDRALTNRMVELMREGEISWATVAAFVDGRQAIRTLSLYTPVLDCRRHPEGHWRCLDSECRDARQRFKQETKLIREMQARFAAREGG